MIELATVFLLIITLIIGIRIGFVIRGYEGMRRPSIPWW
jgi:hypothetical protein